MPCMSKQHYLILQKLITVELKDSVPSQTDSDFHATSGYPPYALHDLLEGIVPVEIALCLDVLIRKKYISLQELNHSICCFPYKWSDKTNCPQPIAPNFTSRKSVGGNAHENWCLLRMIPLMIGDKVPEDEPAWEVLMALKDVVELVVAPFPHR